MATDPLLRWVEEKILYLLNTRSRNAPQAAVLLSPQNEPLRLESLVSRYNHGPTELGGLAATRKVREELAGNLAGIDGVLQVYRTPGTSSSIHYYLVLGFFEVSTVGSGGSVKLSINFTSYGGTGNWVDSGTVVVTGAGNSSQVVAFTAARGDTQINASIRTVAAVGGAPLFNTSLIVLEL